MDIQTSLFCCSTLADHNEMSPLSIKLTCTSVQLNRAVVEFNSSLKKLGFELKFELVKLLKFEFDFVLPFSSLIQTQSRLIEPNRI